MPGLPHHQFPLAVGKQPDQFRRGRAYLIDTVNTAILDPAAVRMGSMEVLGLAWALPIGEE